MASLDDFADTFFGFFDKVTTGAQNVIKGVQDTKLLFDEGQSVAELAKQQAQNSNTLNSFSNGNEASNWSNPATTRNTGEGSTNFGNFGDFTNPQNVLILLAGGLIVYAIAKG